MRRFSVSLFVFVLTLFSVGAEAPAGYYNSCEGKSGKALLQQLCAVIGNHKEVGYGGLWDLYKISDVKPNGKIWDMYSTKEWTPGSEKCGSSGYKAVGDCYNREHSFPKSWFNDSLPMYCDAFHIYPTDGKVNGQRGNNPYGECSSGTTLSAPGGIKALGKSGKCTFPGYTGQVFEPVDEYKGDFARSYFYMAACYFKGISGWKSDMLAGNNYPAFKPWAIDLLLKWHRQDPVSDKEIKRNDVVYGAQKNRNPFIDHPELAEHIWGNKTGEGWSPDGGQPVPMLVMPADGSTVDFGLAGVGIDRSVQVKVSGSDLSQNVTVTVSGAGFKVNTTSLAASAVNDGTASVAVMFNGKSEGVASGTLVLASGELKSTVTLTAKAVTGIPALPAFDITEESFRASWVNVNGYDTMYELKVYLDGVLLDGYPMPVLARGEWEDVDGLEPGTTYTYTLSYGNVTSNVVEVTTASPIPSIVFMYDGELSFATKAGEPSDVAELVLDIENVTGDINVSVTEPFEVSADKESWSRSVVISEGEDRMYLRLNGEQPGSYTTSLRAVAGDYECDDAVASGTITRAGGFVEDFEAGTLTTYSNGIYQGTMCCWKMSNAGVWSASNQDTPYEGSNVCRLGSDSSSSITTYEPKPGGAGTVSFQAKRWGSDAVAKIKVMYSGDMSTWTEAGQFTISGTDYACYEAQVNVTGDVYVRLLQTSGKRVNIDNISISDYSGVGAVEELYYHSWDAFNRGNSLVIQNSRGGDRFQVYGVDGIEYFNDRLDAGETELTLRAGLYIVVSADFSRRVLIK